MLLRRAFEMFDREEFINFAIENDVIGFGQVTLSSGEESYWYTNWRKISNDVFLIDRLSDFVIEFSKGLGEISGFVGVPEGATKLGILTHFKWAGRQENYGKENYIFPMLRSQPKRHGKPEDRYFVGKPRNGVVLLEDVTTTGESLVRSIKDLFHSEVCGISAIGLMDRSEGRATELLSQMDVPYTSMSTAREILPLAYKRLKPGKDIAEKISEEYERKGVEPIILD
jgi:orotate phosphoribosyltransferase